MKAEELMVGDLLMVNSDGLYIMKDTIVTVRSIDIDFSHASHIGCAFCSPLDEHQIESGIWCDYLDPILLTPEILEKNGFEEQLHKIDFQYEITSEKYFIGVSRYSTLFRGIEIYCYNAKTGMTCSYKFNRSDSRPWYVHDLQHAMKCAGIGKEIEL